jgi:flavin reductase (DIM6/NTAB) family NADH-FMN oxidoreductase RutF
VTDPALVEPALVQPGRFRHVLGHFPTGVAVIAGVDTDGMPVGMAIGSFASVSLDPPLVAFMPDKRSRSWPRMRDSGSFCVNVLGSDQESICRTFAVSGTDKFAELSWKRAGSGSPIIDGVLAWIDCDIDVVHEAGDHFIVIGRVRELDVAGKALPLVFFQGGYGRFLSLSLAAWESDLALQMRTADLARPHMEALAKDLKVECFAGAVVGQDMVLIARAGGLAVDAAPGFVGQRVPLEPPMGTAFIAWAPEPTQRAWFEQVGPTATEETIAALRKTLSDVREAHYSIGRGHRWHSRAAEVLSAPDEKRDETASAMHDLMRDLPPDYESPKVNAEDIRTVSTPVFGADGVVVLVLSVTVGGRRSRALDLDTTVGKLRTAADAVTRSLATTTQPGVSAPGSSSSSSRAR